MRGLLGRVVLCSLVMLMCGVLGVRVISLFAATATGPQGKLINDARGPIAFSSDGKTLVAGYLGYADDSLGIWDMPKAELRRTLRGHTDIVNAVAVSPDGRTLASAGHDTTIRLWDMDSGMVKHTWTAHDKPIDHIAFSPNGDLLASQSRDQSVRLWNAQTGRTTRTLATCSSTTSYGSTAGPLRTWTSFFFVSFRRSRTRCRCRRCTSLLALM